MTISSGLVFLLFFRGLLGTYAQLHVGLHGGALRKAIRDAPTVTMAYSVTTVTVLQVLPVVTGDPGSVLPTPSAGTDTSVSLPPTTGGAVVTSTTSSLSANPSSTSTPIIMSFQSLSEMTTCNPSTLTWSYSGPSGQQMALFATNDGIIQSQPNIRRAIRRDAIVNATLSSSIDPSSQAWSWTEVDVPQGWYVIQAVFPSPFKTVLSAQFYVSNGTNVSCLSGTTTLPSSASPSPSTAPSVPVSSALGKKSPIGAIVGAILGAFIIIGIVIAAMMFMRRRRRNSEGTWGGLKSSDLSSTFGASPKSRPQPPSQPSSRARAYPNSPNFSSAGAAGLVKGHRNQSSSLGHILSVDGQGNTIRTSKHFDSSEDLHTFAALDDEEKYLSSPGLVDDLVTPLPYESALRDSNERRLSLDSQSNHRPRRRSGSMKTTQSTTTNNSSQTADSYSFPLPSHSPLPSAGRVRTSMPVTPAPEGEMIPMARSNSVRKTARKPVPQYDASDLLAPPLDRAYLRTPEGDFPRSPHSSWLTHASNVGSGRSVGVPGDEAESRQGSRQGSISALHAADPRSVHYLIPDLPPPSRG